MKVAVVYVYPPNAGPAYRDYGGRFLSSYHQNPPGAEHQSIVVINGAKITSETYCLFSSLPKLSFLEHDNSGYDIGAFQLAARTIPCNLMVFFGVSTFFKHPNWLQRMLEAYYRHGPALYGAMGNRGNVKIRVWPHIRTTAFWMEPGLLNAYPYTINRPEERHPFEHGPDCFTGWVMKRGLQAWVITWAGEYLWKDWDNDPRGFSRGDQSNLLAGDHLCEPPYYPR